MAAQAGGQLDIRIVEADRDPWWSAGLSLFHVTDFGQIAMRNHPLEVDHLDLLEMVYQPAVLPEIASGGVIAVNWP